MSLNQPLISYVIATRNDHHCGDAPQRLQNTVHHLMYNFEGEVIIVDWGSEKPLWHLSDYWKSSGLWPKVRLLYVPPSETSLYGPQLCETVALNVGIRRAKGLYIARLDQDILPGMRYREWTKELSDGGDAKSPAYFSERRELEFDWEEFRNALEPEAAHRWSEWPIDHPGFYRAAVGILLARRADWHNLRGYDESMKYRNHMEHDLCIRFQRTCGLVNLGPIVDYDLYHQWHERPVGIPSNDERSLEYLQECSIEANDIDWGLGKLELKERSL